ncbi:hypothetical protein RMATCC62417_09524 [Rhizopus microsporus]|nr:hypothetical protein RMATCC62417_09524 [Rhizopus microsporus]
MKPPLKIITVKSSITGIGWKLQYISPLKTLVTKVHTLIIHTFSFLKYTLIQELEHNSAFDLQDFANIDFYREVFLSLLQSYKPNKQKISSKSRTYRGLANSHRDMYFQHCSYEPMDLKYAQQIASYEVTKINIGYLKGVSSHFGNKLRMFLNMILKKDERIKAVKNKMKKCWL